MVEKTIVIVGSGPAGCSAAHFLGKKGIKHILFDKAAFPRAKVCGDGLAPKAVLMLQRINADLAQACREKGQINAIWGGRVFSPAGHCTDIYLKKPATNAPNALSIRRKELDALLCQQIDPAFTEVRHGVEIKNIERRGAGFLLTYAENGVEQSLEADLLIGCDGDRSVVRKKLAPVRMDPDHYVAGIRTYYTGIEGLHRDNFFEFYFLKALLPGYLWIFPLPDGSANVGLGMLTSDVSARKANLREILESTIAEHPLLKDRFAKAQQVGKLEGWGLPLGSKPGILSGDGFLLTGDAARLIDPMTGEGVGNALYSGWIAAEAIEKSLETGQSGADFFQKHYDKRLMRCIGFELNFCRRASNLFKYPKLIDHILSRINTRAFLQRTLNSLYEPQLIQKQLRNPFFYMRLLWHLVF